MENEVSEESGIYRGGFEGLEVWKQARNFRVNLSELTKTFPPEERYRLSDQLIRASRSITANIAEGYGRFHYQETIQFCRQARGSLMECLDHLLCAQDENYLSPPGLAGYRVQYEQILKLLNGYITFLKERKAGL